MKSKFIGVLDRARSYFIKHIRRYPSVDRELQLLRRRAQAARLIRGFPDFRHMLSDEPIWKIAKQSAERGQRVLIATSTGSHLGAMQMETSLAVALTMRGAHVEALLCDGVLPGCQLCEPRLFPNAGELATGGPQRYLCRDCYAPGRRSYESAEITVHRFGEHLDREAREFAAKTAQELPFERIENFVFDGLNLGEHAKAGALRFFACATIEREPCGESVLRRYLEAALLSAIAVRKHFQERQYEVVVFHHGIYVPQGIIGEVARQSGVRVVNWNPAYRKNCFIFSHDDTYHHTLMTEPVSTWQGISWDKNHEDRIVHYLRSRWHGTNDWIYFHEQPNFDKKKIREEIGATHDRPIVGLLTNVMWDAQLHYPANAFPDMLSWLLFTIDYFKSRPELQLVIRVHPAEIRGSVPSRQPVVDELGRRFDKLPSNIFVVPPDSNISTYALADICDSVIIYGTKMGVELSAAGIPVIVAGEAWVRNKGITYDAFDVKSYRELLDKLPLGGRLSRETIQLARKYAHHFFFRRMIPVNIFQETKGSSLYRLRERATEWTRPGGDLGLDCICEGILNGTPFIYDSYDTSKGAEER